MKFENLVKTKSLRLVIFCIICTIIITGAGALIFSQKSFYQAFLSAKEIHSYEELNNAKDNDAYIKLYYTDVYDTGYTHTLGGKIDGQYIDFDIDGYIVFALVKKDLAKKILDHKQDYIEGELITFTKENKDAMEHIIKDYVKEYETEGYTKEDVLSALFPKQIDNINYSDNKTTPYFVLFIFVAIDLVFIILGVKAFLVYLNPTKKIKDEEAKNEYDNGDFTTLVKGVYYSKNYIFNEAAFKVDYHKIKDIGWSYRRVIKQNFVTTFKGTVIAFVDGSSIQIPVQSDELFETLLKLNPNIIIGYTPENIKAFNQLVKEHKEQQKGAIR